MATAAGREAGTRDRNSPHGEGERLSGVVRKPVGSAPPNDSPCAPRRSAEPNLPACGNSQSHAPSPPSSQDRQEFKLNLTFPTNGGRGARLLGGLGALRLFLFASVFAPSRLRGYPNRGCFPRGRKESLRSCFLRSGYGSNVTEYRDHGQDAHATIRSTVTHGRAAPCHGKPTSSTAPPSTPSPTGSLPASPWRQRGNRLP
jgi:hypothetical protein